MLLGILDGRGRPARLTADAAFDSDNTPSAFGAKGAIFEHRLLKAFKLVGLDLKVPPASQKMWDFHPLGKAWARILGRRDVNIKVFKTKALFTDTKLVSMLPWEDVPEDYDFEEAARKVDEYLRSKAVGLHTVVWMRPKSIEIEDGIIDATDEEDVDKLNKLLVPTNFESFKLDDFTITVSKSKNSNQIGSIAIRQGGKVIARSEFPRQMGSAVRVAFRVEAKPARVKHRAKSAEAYRAERKAHEAEEAKKAKGEVVAAAAVPFGRPTINEKGVARSLRFKYSGQPYKWEQAKKTKGMAGIGEAAQEFASWTLYLGDSWAAGIHHSKDVRPFAPQPTTLEWSMAIEDPATHKRLRLKRRIPSETGAVDTESLMEALTAAWNAYLQISRQKD